MKIRIPRSVINTLVSIVVLLVLIVGGGVAYIWFSGQNVPENSPAIAVPVETKPTPVIKRPTPNPKAPASAAVQMLTTPIKPGENASITVKTNPEAKCTISVEYDEVPSTDSGLKPKAADDFGTISWTWTVEESVPVGKWPVEVTCVINKKTAVVKGDLEVK